MTKRGWVPVFLLFCSIVRAQEIEPPGEPPPPSEPPACPAHPEYERAFELFADGDLDAALGSLEAVLAACPGYRGAEDLRDAVRRRREARMARELTQPAVTPRATTWPTDEEAERPWRPSPPTPVEGPSDLARVELVITEGLAGIGHGAWICAWGARGCDGPGGAGAGLLGGAIFASLAAALTFDGVTAGQATAIESSTFFGTWLGFSIWMAAGMPGAEFLEERALATVPTTIGQVVGVAAGAALAAGARPEPGAVALTTSAGVWSGAMAGFASMIGIEPFAVPGYQPWHFGVSQLIGVPIGLFAGLSASFVYPTSRGRMLLVDGGTLLIGGLSVPLALLTNANGNNYARHLGIWATAMVPVGFAAMMLITHFAGMDAPDEIAQHISILPGVEGAPGATVLVAW
ncbi:MAG: hypothetical protein IT378_11330 [Sandaracinaceae bacterium]|nr:hypothetical protein [Sandaracinaceae bacterium]